MGRHAGSNAGQHASCSDGIILGHAAGQFSIACQESVIIGYLAAQNTTGNGLPLIANQNTFEAVVIGSNAGQAAGLMLHSVIIGDHAGLNATSMFPIIATRSMAAQGTGTLDESIMISFLLFGLASANFRPKFNLHRSASTGKPGIE